MPAVHVRDVPADVLDGLRRLAALHRRSLNSEILTVLGDAVERHDRWQETLAELERIAATIDLGPDAPKPEDLIRADRDSR